MQVGQVFLLNYYSIFDFDNNRVGFFLHNTSNSEVNSDGVTRIPPPAPVVVETSSSESSKFPVWAIILITLICLGAVLALSTVCFIKMRNKRLAANLSQYNQLEGTNSGKP